MILTSSNITGKHIQKLEEHPEWNSIVYFSEAVVELYGTYECRRNLVKELHQEIKNIPSHYIPYGTLFFENRIYVYNSNWDENSYQYTINIDLAVLCEQIFEIDFQQ